LKKQVIIIPVEIQNREMLAKLYLGAVAVCHGYDVFVGNQREIAKRVLEINPGIYIDKSGARTKRSLFSKLKKLGYAPVALCEEGLVYRNKDRYLSERIDPETIRCTETFYCWGDRQKSDILEKVPEEGKFRVTGNPRFDLLRPEFRRIWEDESDAIAKKIGKFILVNTNFSRFNRLPGTDDVIELLKKRGTLGNEHGILYYKGLVQRLKEVMTAFLAFIPELSNRFPKHTIVVRPHPGENLEPYESLARRHFNVRIINEGSVIPWLIAADVIIHNSCTTGVEGWILERPVISYSAGEESIYDSTLPTMLSYNCCNVQELIEKLDEAINNKMGPKRDSATIKIAAEYIHGLQGTMAADDLIEQLPNATNISPKLLLNTERLLAKARAWVRKIPGLRLSDGLIMLAKQKFPGIEEEEVKNFLHKISLCRQEFENVQIVKLKGWINVFYMTKRGGKSGTGI